MDQCRICGNSKNNTSFIAKEMMFGTFEEFTYTECNKCGCLQLKNIPTDLSKYYPLNYYSLKNRKRNWFKKLLKRQRGKYGLGGINPFGFILAQIWGIPEIIKWIKGYNISFESKILDVGAGNGEYLQEYKNIGFKNLTGIDPYIEKDQVFDNGFKILKKNIHDVDGSFDLIIASHTLEHIEDQIGTLRQFYRLLQKDGILLIRIPVAGTTAWKTYGPDWVQLDAPRHIFIHTVKSLTMLAEQANYEVQNIVFDSNEFQFIGSDLYQQGIPLTSTIKENIPKTIRKSYQKKADSLNKNHDGDQACFYLKKLK